MLFLFLNVFLLIGSNKQRQNYPPVAPSLSLHHSQGYCIMSLSVTVQTDKAHFEVIEVTACGAQAWCQKQLKRE